MFDFKVLILVSLGFFLLVSALAVINSKYQSRQVFIEIQKQEKLLDHYEIEWGRLQIELTMLTEENRIEKEAKDKLNLIMPWREKIIYIKP